jgi:transcriptional antiterminator RfaH
VLFWQVIYTKPKQEQKATEHLENQGVEVYCPKIQLEKIVKGQVKDIFEPLFPRYLFVKIPESVSWTSVRSSRGVVDFVKFGNKIAEVQNSIIGTIEEAISINQKCSYGDIPDAGQQVIITEGEFVGLEGVFQERESESRCFVLLEFLGRANRVKMDLTALKKTG